MTEKRFEMVIVDVQGNFYYLDKVTDEKIDSTLVLEGKLNELADENEQLKQLVNEAEDIIICQCTPHYQKQWENIKKNIKGDVE